MKAILIYNITAGQIWNQFDPQEAKKYLNSCGWDVELAKTEKMEEGRFIASKAVKENFDAVIAAGGDGTINQIVQEIACTPVRLAIIPAGTTNVLARELGIPLNAKEAIEIIPKCELINFDLGKVDSYYFFLMAGIGFDARITKEVDPVVKRWTGLMAFVGAGIKSFFMHKGVKMKLIMVDKNNKKKVIRRLIYQLIISNTATYASGFILNKNSKFNDGLLEVTCVKDKGVGDVAKTLFSFFMGRHREWVELEHYTIKKIKIKSAKPVPLQIDGEPIGYTPASIEVVPNALKIYRPPNEEHKGQEELAGEEDLEIRNF